MRTRVLLLVSLILLLVLAACGGGEPTAAPTEPPAPEPTKAPVAEPTKAPAAEAVELRFTYYADGKEAEVMQPILDAFEAANPGITVKLDVVPYQTIDEQLPVQVETGDGPDLARITNFAAYRGKLLDLEPLLEDAAYFEANFPGPVLAAMRAEGASSGLHGFPDALTVTGPYVNKTLFDQAGIDLPGEGTSWEEWTELTKQVAEATGVQYALSIDRTGHRFAGPAMSMGATLIDAGGNFTVDTAGYRGFAELLNSWHVEGITPAEVWLVGDSLNNCIDFLINGELVMCMSGSWQIGRMAGDVGDAFDWVVVPNPTGAGGSTGVAGGSAVVAFGATEHPEAVAKLMEFLIQPENYGAFSAGTLALPAQIDVASQGVAFETDDASVLGALAAYTAEVPKLQDQAVGLNVHPFAFAYYRNSANRVGQYLTGELTLDEALQRLQQDIDDAIAEATGVAPAPAEAAELRFTYYADGKEAEVMQPILDAFEAANPGITVKLDVVPYQTIDEQLPVQVETGDGPDLARITNFAAYRGKLLDLEPLLEDAAYYEANFPGPVLAAMRAEGASSGLHGFPDALTVTGPYVNKTLFDQAGIDLPGEGTSWEEWTELTKQVAEATGVQYALSIDRTGHRFAGPAMSMGATLIDAGGNFTVDTAGYRGFAELLNSWHVEGITPAEVWLVGDSLNNCIDFVINGELVMCMSGSWQIGRMAGDVGDAFDWVVVPNPTGAGGSTGVAGGSAVVAFGATEHPEAVAKLMEFLIQPENYGAFSAGTLALPAQIDVASQGVAFETDDASVLGALAAYTAEVPKLQDQAVGLNVHPFAFAYYRNSANRMGQYLTGELTLDEALQRLQQDIDDAIAEATGVAPAPAEAAELRFTYYADGKEAEVMQPILDAFEAANPGITVKLDVVPYQTIDEQLPVQVETGDGPDLARITNFAAYRGKLLDLTPYLADAAYYEANFPGPVLAAMRAEGASSGLHGFPDALTVTGPYVNKTLFDQAGIDLPGEGTSWEEWTELTKQVSEATGVQYALSIDRTGHRFAGPAMSMGATLIDAGGNFTVDTAGFRGFSELLNSWHEEGITPAEVWLVGDSLNNCIDFLINGELVMCMSGSWQIGRMAGDVGDAFDWVVVPNPTGAGGSTGVAGGSAVVAFGATEHPEAVAKLMEFLIQPENYGAFSAGTLALPAQIDVASQGVAFETDDASVLGALAAYTAEVPKLQDQAVGLNVHPFAFAYYRNSANRVGQYLTGELTLDEALQRLQQDIDDAIAEATK